MIEKFGNSTAFLDALRSRIQVEGQQSEYLDAILDGIGHADTDLREEPRTSSSLDMRIGSWFIRDDDLPVFEALAAAITIASSLVTGGLSLAIALPALSSLAGSTWKVWRKGGRFSDEQMIVLTLIESQGPISFDQLVEALDANEYELASAEVRRILMALGKVELADGTTAEVVREKSPGVWKAAGF